MDSGLIFVEYQFSYQEVHIKEHFDSGKIHIVGTSAEFDGSAIDQQSLVTDKFGTVFLYDRPDKIPCAFQYTKMFQAQDNLKTANPVLVDRTAQIHLEIGAHASPERCPTVTGGYWSVKNHPQLLLAKLGDAPTSDLEARHLPA